jgi:hypothetical protein
MQEFIDRNDRMPKLATKMRSQNVSENDNEIAEFYFGTVIEVDNPVDLSELNTLEMLSDVFEVPELVIEKHT